MTLFSMSEDVHDTLGSIESWFLLPSFVWGNSVSLPCLSEAFRDIILSPGPY